MPAADLQRRFFALAIILLGLGIATIGPAWMPLLLSIPSGIGAAILWGASPSLSEGVVSFVAAGTEIRVTKACSGWLFFCLLCSVGAIYAQGWKTAWGGLPAVLLLTLAGNIIRILSWAAALPWLAPVLPEKYLGAAHEMLGAALFLPLLLLFGGWLHSRTQRQNGAAPNHRPSPVPNYTSAPNAN